MEEKEKQERLKNQKDMIDMRKIMNSREELIIPKKILVTNSSIKSVITFPLVNYFKEKLKNVLYRLFHLWSTLAFF